jgi:hypothetical protein
MKVAARSDYSFFVADLRIQGPTNAHGDSGADVRHRINTGCEAGVFATLASRSAR